MKFLSFTNAPNVRYFILLAIIIFSIYFNSFGNAFVWDDNYLVLNNPFIKNIRYIQNILSNPLFPACKTNYYRPLHSFSNMFDFLIWKLNPLGYHLTNTIIHTLNTILIFILINKLFADNELSGLTALLFAICPLHVSAVAYISGRADLLASFFIIAALLSFITYMGKKNDSHYLTSIVLFLFALLSKEIALIFPFLLLLTYKVKSRGIINNKKELILRIAPFFLLSLVYIFLRFTLLNFIDGTVTEHKGTFLLKIITFFQIVFSYIRLIFYPDNLYMQHRMQFDKTLFAPYALVSFFIFLFILILIIKSFRKNNILFWSLGWFLTSIVPVYFVMFSHEGLYSKGETMMAEHWLYIALVGAFTFIAFATITLNRLKSVNLASAFLKKTSTLIIAALVFFYVIQTVRTNNDWRDGVALFSKILKYAPSDVATRLWLAVSLLDTDKVDEAVREYSAVSVLDKDSAYIIHKGLGTAHFKKGNYLQAISEYKNALREIKYTDKGEVTVGQRMEAEILRRMGIVYFYQGQLSDAQEQLIKAIQLNSLDANAHSALGVVYARERKFQEAIKYLRISLELDSYNPEAYNNLGLVYANMDNMAGALEVWQKALKINPHFIEAKKNIDKAKSWISNKN